jgi:hypothetical protein
MLNARMENRYGRRARCLVNYSTFRQNWIIVWSVRWTWREISGIVRRREFEKVSHRFGRIPEGELRRGFNEMFYEYG